MNLFKKRKIVGVSVTPEHGLEVAEIDFENKVVLKYASKFIDYNSNLRQIADMDIFKEALQDLFLELEIPSDADIVLSMPPVTFKVADYPASIEDMEVENAINEDLISLPLFQQEDPIFSAVKLPNSTMQSTKWAYVASQHRIVSEIVFVAKDMKHKIYAIDSSASSVFNALNYLGCLNNIEQDTSWILMTVDNLSCRIMTMIGSNIVDAYEEKIAIGEVLGDAENYATVINAVQSLLNNLPSKYLYLVSKTNIISAEILSEKLSYSAPIIHMEVNNFAKEPLINISPDLAPEISTSISLDVIGAAIRREIEPYVVANLNLYNKSLGDLYFSEQPPEIDILGHKVVFTAEFLAKIFIAFMIIVLIILVPTYIYLSKTINDLKSKQSDIEQQIAEIDRFLEEHKDLSSEQFDEGDEIKIGLEHNKSIYSYYTIVGTEIPKKLWLTHLKLSEKTTIEGQADNLESIYAFFKSIKDYNQSSDIKLQKLGLASKASQKLLNDEGSFDKESILTSASADFYEFRISNEQEVQKDSLKKDENSASELPDLEAAN